MAKKIAPSAPAPSAPAPSAPAPSAPAPSATETATVSLTMAGISTKVEYVIGKLANSEFSAFCRNAYAFKCSRNSRCALLKGLHSKSTQNVDTCEIANEIAYILTMAKIAEIFAFNQSSFNMRVTQNDRGILTARDFVTLCFGNGDTAKLRSIAA